MITEKDACPVPSRTSHIGSKSASPLFTYHIFWTTIFFPFFPTVMPVFERTGFAPSPASGQAFLPLLLTSLHTSSPLLTLPAEIRNSIYDYAVNWPSLSRTFRQLEFPQTEEVAQNETLKGAPLSTFPTPHFGSLSTPSLLLVNRQIYFEVLAVLYEKPFIIDSPPPYVPQLAKPMVITEFIGKYTLQKLRFVTLSMDLVYRPGVDIASAWLKTVEYLLDVWFVRFALESVTVRIRYVEPDRSKGWTFGEAGHHRNVKGILTRVRKSIVLEYLGKFELIHHSSGGSVSRCMLSLSGAVKEARTKRT